jgi:iron complex outermembrane recepter protein
MKKLQLQCFNKTTLARSIAGMCAVIALFPSAARAQGQAVEEIQITGSRVQSSGMTSPVPITVITTQELFDFEPGSTVSQQLDALPQFANNGSPQRGAGGNAVVGGGGPGALNLRGLNVATTEAGISRTLTLLDGARVVPNDKRNTVNVDLFPTALMRTVDVVTGGASAAYGADALGGVVNFVLDREFEGLKISAGTGMHEYERVGKQYEFSVAGGTRIGDRLHVVGSVEARHIKELASDRNRWDSTREQWGYVTNPAWTAWRAATPSSVPSSQAPVPRQLSSTKVVTTNDAPTGLIRGTNTSLDWMKFSVDGTRLEPYVLGSIAALPGANGSTASMVGGPESDIAFLTSTGGPTGQEAISRSGFGGIQYDFTSTLQGFAHVMIGRTESNDTSDNANFSLSTNFAPLIAVDNYYLPQSVKDVMRANNLTQISLHKRSAQFDGRPEIGSTRSAKNIYTQWQGSVGFDWEFIPEWNLRASWQRGQSKRNSQTYNLMQVDRAYLGMDVVANPTTGQPMCRVNLFNPTAAQLAASVAGRTSKRPINPFLPAGTAGNYPPLTSPVEPEAIASCKPYNIFGSGNMSQEVIDWIGTDKFLVGYVDQDFAETLVTGDLFEGWGAGPIGFAGGLTWRDQQINNNTLPVATDLLGPPLNAPNIGIRGFPAAIQTGGPNLNLNSTALVFGGQTDVWEWFSEVNVPVWEFASGQRIVGNAAVRRSDYDRSGIVDSWKVGVDVEVTSDLRVRLTRSQDTREPSFQELFDAQVSGGNINDPTRNGETYGISQTRGGNPNLRPEIAKTNVAGFVYQPSFANWIEGLSLSVDWYDVNIDDAVAQLGLQRLVDLCYAGNDQSCSVIQRGADGRVTMILDGFLNVAGARARGVDTEVAWRREVDLFSDRSESITLRWITGYTAERSDTPFEGATQNLAGGVGTPKIGSTMTFNYSIDSWSVQMQARHVDSVTRNLTWVEGVDVDDNSIASMTWFNSRIGYSGELESGATWNVGFNIQNILDKEPPLFATTNNNYDGYGRRYNLSVNFNW